MKVTYDRVDEQDYRFEAQRAEGRLVVTGRVYKAWDRSHGGWHWRATPDAYTDQRDFHRRSGHATSRNAAVVELMRATDPMPLPSVESYPL